MSPSSMRRTIADRDSPKTRTSALSMRSPATPSGTLSVRNSLATILLDYFCAPGGAKGGISLAIKSTDSNAAQTIAISATLNTGQRGSSIQSIT